MERGRREGRAGRERMERGRGRKEGKRKKGRERGRERGERGRREGRVEHTNHLTSYMYVRWWLVVCQILSSHDGHISGENTPSNIEDASLTPTKHTLAMMATSVERTLPQT